ncbi:MAG: AAA family ATPase [Parvibaculum sp.]|nr:AAA family ATPase [Nitrospira sp.]MBX3491556.1 AAA family ATPase [Parvibaculum sp.]
MLFRRIAIRNFRKHLSPVVIDELGEGVTVIAGDNEEGKSTLLDAIRTGLFERQNLGGKAADTMQPFGSTVRPEVRIDFEVDGSLYSITKGFIQKASARLTTPAGTFEGAAAEERLAELLTFRLSQRGESKPDDRGILGLFWLEQGRVLDGLGLGETGRSTLRGSLEDEVGNVLGGTRGRKLLEAARAQRDALLTSTGRPRGDLSAANDEAEKATARALELEAERAEYDQEIDHLTQVRRDLAQISHDRVLEKAEEALSKAESEARSIELLIQRHEAAEQAVALTKAQLDNAADHSDRRQALIQAVEGRERDLIDKRDAHTRLSDEAGPIADRQQAAEIEMMAKTEARETAETRVVVAQGRSRIESLDKQIAELHRKISEIEKLASQRKADQDRIAQIAIDQRGYEKLQTLESDIRAAKAALGAVATRVRFAPIGGQRVKRNGVELTTGETVQVTDRSHFELDGFGEIDIEPGTSELADRRARLKKAEDALDKGLTAVGMADIAAAKIQLEQRTSLDAQVKEAKRLIDALAPEGAEALATVLGEQKAERSRLSDTTSALMLADTADPETESRVLTAAKDAEKEARTALDLAQKEHQEHVIQLTVAVTALEAAAEAVTTAKADLQKARDYASDTELTTKLESAKDALTKAQNTHAESTKRLNAANPEEVELRRERAQSTLATVDAERRQLREEQIGLQSRLTALGKNGISELLEEARGRETRTLARRDRLQRDAAAWNRLVSTLVDAERDAKEAFLEPVLKRVDPFLRLLFPDARVTLNEETLEITGVVRGGREEPYPLLSIGTREQLSILVRLAFAVYLREKGFPAAVILDDALVYADDDRFERMQLALRKAAETVQVLILTCRPRDWREFGAPIRRLGDGKTKKFEPLQ